MFDKNGDGQITLKELNEALGDGSESSSKKMEFMIKMSDTNGDRKVNYEEFANMMEDSDDEEDNSQKEMTQAFRMMDVNGDGFITKEELKEITECFGAEEPGEIDEMISQADTDGDGKVNFEEFIKIYEEMK